MSCEAQRQQRLLQQLWQPAPDADLTAWLRDAPAAQARGLRAYRANAQATAARALAAAYPTVAALVGADTFGQISHRHWLQQPPQRGDLAEWGADLAQALADDAQLADVAYLADVARLDWAVQRCELAADHDGPVQSLALLASADPATLTLHLRPGTAVLRSAWPIVSLWRAHHLASDDMTDGSAATRLDQARAALAQSQHQTALVWRSQWRAQVGALDQAAARFTSALLQPIALDAALDAAGADFAFEPWLLRALQQGWLAEVRQSKICPPVDPPADPPDPLA